MKSTPALATVCMSNIDAAASRTFAMQMEALKRYRSGAEQKLTLQHA
jgi:hypothetical protein